VKLSPNFTLAELTHSETAERLGLNNTPSKEVEANLVRLARMLEEGRNCDEIVMQMSAVSKAVNTAAFTLISASLKECIVEGKNNSDQVTEQLQKLFLSLA
jgi:DNA-binding FrmR family transcriptional regulator